ncbi:hypothetical protein MRX96_034088 [Rhipicephalus microplus]
MSTDYEHATKSLKLTEQSQATSEETEPNFAKTRTSRDRRPPPRKDGLQSIEERYLDHTEETALEIEPNARPQQEQYGTLPAALVVEQDRKEASFQGVTKRHGEGWTDVSSDDAFSSAMTYIRPADAVTAESATAPNKHLRPLPQPRGLGSSEVTSDDVFLSAAREHDSTRNQAAAEPSATTTDEFSLPSSERQWFKKVESEFETAAPPICYIISRNGISRSKHPN